MISRKKTEGPLPYVRKRPVTNPILPVDDMAVAEAFYQQLGFEVHRYDDGYAWVKHCGWEWFHLRGVESVAGNQASTFLHVADAREWHQAMTEAAGGAVDVTAPELMPWNKVEFSIVDPAGNTVRIGSEP